jgi:hypothetical protein
VPACIFDFVQLTHHGFIWFVDVADRKFIIFGDGWDVGRGGCGCMLHIHKEAGSDALCMLLLSQENVGLTVVSFTYCNDK